MLRDTKELLGMTIGASDGDIGQVRDLYFDDEAWVVRYLVVESGTWLSNRRVLVSPTSIDVPDWSLNRLPARLTRVQVRNSPDIDAEKPVSRQHELQYLAYYQYPFYWAGEGLSAQGAHPGITAPGLSGPGFEADRREAQMQAIRVGDTGQSQDKNDLHLRSYTAVIGYHIHAVDGELGHVQGMLVDEQSWAIRYLIVNTSNWWLGHRVLIAPESITEVDWADRRVVLDLTRQAVQEAAPYDGSLLPDRSGETLVYEHYGHKGAWQYDSLSPLRLE